MKSDPFTDDELAQLRKQVDDLTEGPYDVFEATNTIRDGNGVAMLGIMGDITPFDFAVAVALTNYPRLLDELCRMRLWQQAMTAASDHV